MPTRRGLLAGGATGLSASVLAGAATAAPAPLASPPAAVQGEARPKPVAPAPAKPITAEDFVAPPGVHPAERSAAYDPKHPFLFEGLKPRYATSVIRSRFIRMRDGVGLSTDLCIPLGAKLPLPVVLARTPYSKAGMSALRAVLPEQGFIFASQDVRGRYESEGIFKANSGIERQDGYDTVDWLAAQPWCNGAIGAWGSSYVGETAARLSAMRHPNHKASIIMFDGSSSAGTFQNGAFMQSGVMMLRELVDWFRNYVPGISYGPPPHIDREAWFSKPYAQNYATQPVNQPKVDMEALMKTLPVYDMLDRSGAAPTDFAEWMLQAKDPGDPYWSTQGFLTEADRFDVPALHVTGPQDTGDSGPSNFNMFRRNSLSKRSRDNQYLLFSPAPHSGYGGGEEHTIWGARDFGDTRYPYYRSWVEWYGHWLRGDDNDVEAWPKVKYFVAGANAWRTADSWPPADVEMRKVYLRSAAGGAPRRGRLSLDPPTSHEPAIGYRYDPADPTPSEAPGSALDLIGSSYSDYSAFGAREDVLVYTGEVLTEAVEIAGPVKLVLHVSSSAKDTDFCAVLLEMDEQGRAVNVTHGVTSARYREGLDRSVFMEPGGVYEVTVDLWFASIRFAKGRRISLQIASACFPAFVRNLNTGGDNYTETQWVVAENAVHHGKGTESYLSLPVRTRAE